MVTKGYFKKMGTKSLVHFPLNPENLQHTRLASYGVAGAVGNNYPFVYYIKGEGSDFNLDLRVVKSRGHNIESFEKYLRSLLPPENRSKAVKPVQFYVVIGTFIRKCVLEELTEKTNEWDSNLRPIDKEFNLKLKVVV